MLESLTTWGPVVERIGARCVLAGLDLLQPFQVGWYNRAVEAPYRLPDLGQPAHLGLLIGNTRALWAPFVQALRQNPSRLDATEPLDDYVVAAVTDALRTLPLRWRVRWAHDTQTPVAMQRLAHVAGLAHLAPSHLSVHQVYGPWIALRAAVVIDIDGPPGPPPAPSNPCVDCEHHCMTAYRSAVEVAGDVAASHAALTEHWTDWLAVRDACPTGRSHRYCDDQVRYHYTKERALLRAASRA